MDQSTLSTETPPDDSRYPMDKVTFGVAAGLVLAFVVWGALDSDGMSTGTGKALAWITDNFGWLFVLVSAAFLVFAAYLALTRYGNIRLGPDDSTPEFSTFSWVSMMFATGMGIGLIFWGVAEPLTHLTNPPLGRGEPGSRETARVAMEYTFFHWGLHPWAMYAVIGLAIGYFAYRKGTGNLVSGAFGPLLGRRATEGPGKAIDIIAIFATLFGSATSLGLGALQITGGLDNVFGSGDSQMDHGGVIAVLTLCFVLSAVTGIERGVQFLSNANAIAALALVLFLFVVGPTVFIMGTFTESLGGYFTHLPTMAFRTGAFGGTEWVNGWTVFYWAWWISWTPVRRDVHRAHLQGQDDSAVRRLRDPGTEPGLVHLVLDHGRLGIRTSAQRRRGPRCDRQLRRRDRAGALRDLARVPPGLVTVVLAIFLIAIFFITGADSASIVMGMLSQHGTEHPMRSLVIFWGSPKVPSRRCCCVSVG